MVGKNEIIHTRKVTYIRKYLFVYTVNVRVNINININIPESIEIEEKSDEEFDWKKIRKKSWLKVRSIKTYPNFGRDFER